MGSNAIAVRTPYSVSHSFHAHSFTTKHIFCFFYYYYFTFSDSSLLGTKRPTILTNLIFLSKIYFLMPLEQIYDSGEAGI